MVKLFQPDWLYARKMLGEIFWSTFPFTEGLQRPSEKSEVRAHHSVLIYRLKSSLSCIGQVCLGIYRSFRVSLEGLYGLYVPISMR